MKTRLHCVGLYLRVAWLCFWSKDPKQFVSDFQLSMYKNELIRQAHVASKIKAQQQSVAERNEINSHPAYTDFQGMQAFEAIRDAYNQEK